MGQFFSRPSPQQAVPGDLSGGRQAILDAIFGTGGSLARPSSSAGRGGNTAAFLAGKSGAQVQGGGTLGQARERGADQNTVLQAILGLINDQTPGGDVLGPLRASADQRLNDQLGELNASTPGRFSSANLYQQGQLLERSQNDFNLLAAQVLEQGRNRQLSAIMGLLGPVLGPTFGGPFQQGPSGFENLLGLLDTGSNFFPTGGGGK